MTPDLPAKLREMAEGDRMMAVYFRRIACEWNAVQQEQDAVVLDEAAAILERLHSCAGEVDPDEPTVVEGIP